MEKEEMVQDKNLNLKLPCQDCKNLNRKCFKNVLNSNKQNSKVNNLLRFIELHYYNYECNISFILENNFISYPGLISISYKYFLCSPKRILENLRMEKAIFDFSSGATVVQVALSSGYNELRPFQKAFQKRFNCTPKYIKEKLSNSKDKNEFLQKLLDKLWEPEKMTYKKDI